MILFATAKVAENHLVTSVPLSEEYVKVLAEHCNVKVHYLHIKSGGNPLHYLAALIRIHGIIKEINPDVVHVHGSWDWRAAAVECQSRRQRIVTLVSPHRGLSQELISIDFWNRKLPRLVLYQAWMVRNCTAVIAINDKERDDITALGLKKRIEVLPQMPKENESIEPLREVLMTYYRKALDSTYNRDLMQKEREFVATALRSVIVDDDVVTEKPDIVGVSFRRIFFYAYDEDVMPQFVDGCQKMQLPIPPPLNVAEVPRYRNPKAKIIGTLKDIPIQVKPLKLPADKTSERDVVTMISKAEQLSMSRLTLRNYAELYDMFRHSDFNEEIVVAELKRLHLRRFTKKMQKRLAEMFELKQGYNII